MVYKALVNYAFAFLLTMSKVNKNLGGVHFGVMESVRNKIDFRGLISSGLINNPYIIQDYLKSE